MGESWLEFCHILFQASVYAAMITIRSPVHRKVVLVIDDDHAERELYGRLLWYNGFDVSFAETGEDGLELATERRPDLVLLDMMLPGMDGLGVCETLKTDERTHDIPVLALSGRRENELGAAARRLGCENYLEKPISPVTVLHEVERLIGRQPPPGEIEEYVA
jgi:CheY-like chemotaxis protein